MKIRHSKWKKINADIQSTITVYSLWNCGNKVTALSLTSSPLDVVYD